MKPAIEDVERSFQHSDDDFRLLVATVRDYAIFMLDPTGRITSWNAGAERLKGYRTGEILGKHFSIFYPAGEKQKAERELAIARVDGRVEDEGWRLRKDGSRFWANVVITAIHDETGRLRAFAKVTRDLTERRKAEDDRLRLAQTQEAVRLRDEFLSIASHELRTPINALSLYLQTAKLSLAKTHESPEAIYGVDKAVKQVRRLTDLVDRLLDASRLTEGRLKLVLEPVDLNPLFLNVVENLRADIDRSGSPIVLDLADHVSGMLDRLRIEQLLTNIIENAIKYGRGGPIQVDLRQQDDVAVIRIADRGIGIEEADGERIFGRFERAERARRFGGLGLGLYISKSIVDAHGGTIEVQSAVGVGSTFTITLPLRKEA